MARPTSNQWQDARQVWEADPVLSYEALATRLGVTRQAVCKQAKIGNWTKVGALRKVAERAQLQADGKVAQVAGATEKNGEEATFDAAVDLRANVIDRHRSDWAEHRKLFTLADIKAKFETGKQAKISAEMLALRQKGERAAYGLEDTGANQPPLGNAAEVLSELAKHLPN